MRTSTLLTLVVTLIASLVSATEPIQSIDIFAWPQREASPRTLAKISYNSTDATVKSYTEPKIPAGTELVRVGFYHGGNQKETWSGIATAASSFGPGKEKKLLLHLNSAGQLYHVGFKATDGGKTSAGKDGLEVEVVPMRQGPTPHLNKPVVLNAEGKLEDQVAEKTFFQKYWWVIGLFLLFQVVMSGGGGEK